MVKKTSWKESRNIEFRAELFNVFNHPVFGSPQAAFLTNPGADLGNYGYVDIAGGDTSILVTVNRPRVVQFALKFNF